MPPPHHLSPLCELNQSSHRRDKWKSPVQTKTHLKCCYQGRSVPRVWRVFILTVNKIQRSLSQVCCHPELLSAAAAAVDLLSFLLIWLHICGANNVLTTRWHHPDVRDICLLQPSKSNLHHCASSCCSSSNKQSKCTNSVVVLKLCEIQTMWCFPFALIRILIRIFT